MTDNGRRTIDGGLVRRPSSIAAALHRATETLAHLDHGRLTAEVLLAHVLRLTRTQLLARPEQIVSADQSAEYNCLVARAATGEPLAYLGGRREFYGLDFLVDARVLVPRPETELLVDLALASVHAHTPIHVLDVGTGSGCIAVTLAAKWPKAHVTATDISGDALAVAWANAERHGVAERIEFLQNDLLSSAVGRPSSVNLLTANLPYIASGELKALAVARHEPHLALDGGPDGLTLIRRLLADAPRVMALGGRLLLEIGSAQGHAVIGLARAAFPAAKVEVHKDWAGLDRVVEIGL